MGIKQEVYSKDIMGIRDDETKLYLVNWFYMANFGTYMIWAKDELAAMSWSKYVGQPEVKFQVTKVDPTSMPVLMEAVK